MATPLSDLDELVLRCRDNRARSLIAEAINSYKSGAFRASIVATWIAVSFDLIEKLRELALAGDSGAERQIEKVDRIRTTNDIASALSFERDLLKLCRDEFELISPLEYVDLERLQSDRHRCAHPSLADDSDLYKPSAELARAHIVSAVDHVLRHPPAQGKFALDRMLAQVNSEYFSTKESDAIAAFSTGPLRRARDSLVRNFTIVLVKSAFGEPGRPRARRITALAAISKMHPATYQETLSQKLSAVIRPVEDSDLYDTISVLSRIPQGWDALDLDIQHRLRNFVAALPSEHIGALEWLLGFDPVYAEAKRRTARATRSELKDEFFLAPPKELMDRIIQIYLESGSFDQANAWGKEIIGYKTDFTSDQIKLLIGGAAENGEITGSFRFQDVINELRSTKLITLGDFDELLRANKLEQFCSPADDDNS